MDWATCKSVTSDTKIIIKSGISRCLSFNFLPLKIFCIPIAVILTKFEMNKYFFHWRTSADSNLYNWMTVTQESPTVCGTPLTTNLIFRIQYYWYFIM